MIDIFWKKRDLVLVGILIVSNLLLWSGSGDGLLRVHFFDVSQGDAILVETPGGKRILIDTGRDNSVVKELGKVLPLSVSFIDLVVLTHADSDHVGGLDSLVEKFDVGRVLYGGNFGTSDVVQTLEEKNIKLFEVRRGMVFDISEGVFLKILFPDREIAGVEKNLGSVVLQIVYGENEFLFTGDSPKSIETLLVLLDGKELESDVLKLGHHGSKTSSALSFLGFVNPTFAIVSAGEDNSYGHPHEEVLENVKVFTNNILETKDGVITFVGDGKEVWLE
jgi:competence protein ComEC